MARASLPKPAAQGRTERRYSRRDKVAHLTPTERVARGRAARNEAPRTSHGAWAPAENRPDPIALLEQQAESRVPELVPIRYGRMLASPFTFFRGAALIMASDLSSTPRTGLTVQACGDAHLSNFGAFATPERAQVFDINDFDETLPGPWEWDVKRLAASFVVAGRANGFDQTQTHQVARTMAVGYRTAMAGFAGQRTLDVWYAKLDMDTLMGEVRKRGSAESRRQTEKALAKSRRRDSLQAFSKFVEHTSEGPRFRSDPPLVVTADDLLPDVERDALTESLRTLVRTYRRTLQEDRRHLVEQFRIVDIARKVVGVGSVGTRAWMLLMLGRDDDDPLILQAKEAQPSVLEPFVGRSEYTNQGQRVVAGQRLMQAASDIFLGWQRVTGMDGVQRDFYVRQLRDWKGSAVIETMDPTRMIAYAEVCAWTLARAHARSGDAIAIASYLGTGKAFDNALADFAESYADQNERDHAALVAAVEEGRVSAQTGL